MSCGSLLPKITLSAPFTLAKNSKAYQRRLLPRRQHRRPRHLLLRQEGPSHPDSFRKSQVRPSNPAHNRNRARSRSLLYREFQSQGI